MRRLPLAAAMIVTACGAIYRWHTWQAGRFIESSGNAYIKADAVQIAPRRSREFL